MNVACPECTHVYRLDPDRLGDGDVRTRCRECSTPFTVAQEREAMAAGVVVNGRRAETGAPGSAGADVGERTPAGTPIEPPAPPSPPSQGAAPSAPVFGPQDPETRARRLARALVSDIKVYNQKRWVESRAKGTLRKDFREEILKSWDEYVQQVGQGMAKGTPFFRDALNDILGEGKRVF